MTRARNEPESFLPLPHTSLEILLALLEGEAHGYGIKRFIENRSVSGKRVRAGTLYEALARLERNGLIRESQEPPEDTQSTSRWRYYGISKLGREVLRAELGRLSSLVSYARSKNFTLEPEAS